MTPHEIPNPTVYVLGFAFDLARFTYHSVCLMEKKRPDWQKGLLNGVGGKCKPGEMPSIAMSREFLEETGVIVYACDWTKFFVMRFDNGAVVHCFTTKLPEDQTPKTTEDERVDMYRLGNHGRWYLGRPAIRNLNWLIPMAYHELTSKDVDRMIVAD